MTKTPSIADDLKKAEKAIRLGKLDAYMEKLDSNDVLGSLQRVPKEITRLLLALLSISDIESKLEDVEASQRKPVQALLDSARKHDIARFVEKLRRILGEDSKARKALGLDITAIPKETDATAAKIDNTISRVVATPQFMLKSRRVYAEVAFLQDEELLLRSELELDDLLGMAAQLVQIAGSTLTCLKDSMGKASPNIHHDRCEHHMGNLRKTMRRVSSLLSEFSNEKPGNRAQKRPRKTTKRRTP